MLDSLLLLLPCCTCMAEENLGTTSPRIIFSVCFVFECGLEFPSLKERLLLEAWAYTPYKIHSNFWVSSAVPVLQEAKIINRNFLKVF